MNKIFKVFIPLSLIAAIAIGVCWNNYVAASIYEKSIECIINSDYEGATEYLKAVNPKLRDHRLNNVLYPKGKHESFYKDSSCLYAYARALQCFHEGLPEDYIRYYLECIPEDYSGVLSEEINHFIDEFMNEYYSKGSDKDGRK